MNKNTIHDAALALLKQRGKREPLSQSDLAVALALRPGQRATLAKALREMVVRGDIVHVRGGRFAIGKELDLLTGELVVVRSGNAYLKTADGEEVFVPSNAQGTALPGDVVVVRLTGRRRDGVGMPEAEVVRVEERCERRIVGTLKSAGKFHHIAPLNPIYKHSFYVAEAGQANAGDRVVARFARWDAPHLSPEAIIEETLGPASDPSSDTPALVRQFELRDVFPDSVIDEAERIAEGSTDMKDREDLRSELVITIDPDRARDFDDALSLKTLPNGNVELGVHIADVSHYVRPGSPLDVEARLRGNSVYFVDSVVPMLPEQLSNVVCSLKPDEDRLTFSAFIEFDEQARFVRRRFAKTAIRSAVRFTYRQAMALLDGSASERKRRPAAVGELLTGLNRLAQSLRARRFANHALDLDSTELEFSLDAKGDVTDIQPVVSDASHQLVEECMIAANEAVAVELAARGLAFPARFHAPPSPDKMAALQEQLTAMGYRPGDLAAQRNLARFLAGIRNDPLVSEVRLAVLKSLTRAIYSATERGHFGLAKEHYLHFTSPIRRYPDLVVHRILARALGGGGRKTAFPDAGALEQVAEHCTRAERVADDAERESVELKKLRFLARQIEDQRPRVYDATVSQALNFGAFVEVESLQQQGLLPVSAMSTRFVKFDRGKEALRDGRTEYKRGKKIKVFPVAVDMDLRRVEFGLYRTA